jgi:hypothetical protein
MNVQNQKENQLDQSELLFEIVRGIEVVYQAAKTKNAE